MKIKNCVLGLMFSVVAATSLASSGLMDQEAPDFALKSSSGENLRLSEFRGDVVMINFWATWCKPCIKEMPYFELLQNAYPDKVKVVFDKQDEEFTIPKFIIEK